MLIGLALAGLLAARVWLLPAIPGPAWLGPENLKYVADMEPGWWRCHLRLIDGGGSDARREHNLVFLMWLPEPGDYRGAIIRNGSVDIPVTHARSPDGTSIAIDFPQRRSQIRAAIATDTLINGDTASSLSGAWTSIDSSGVERVMDFYAEQPSNGQDNRLHGMRTELGNLWLSRNRGMINPGGGRIPVDIRGVWDIQYSQSGSEQVGIRQLVWDDIFFQNIEAVIESPFDGKRAFSGYSCQRGVGLDYFDGQHAFAIRGIFAVDGVRSELSLSARQIEGVVNTGVHKQESFTAKRVGPLSD